MAGSSRACASRSIAMPVLYEEWSKRHRSASLAQEGLEIEPAVIAAHGQARVDEPLRPNVRLEIPLCQNQRNRGGVFPQAFRLQPAGLLMLYIERLEQPIDEPLA